MAKPIKGSINVSRIDKSLLKKIAEGKVYLNFVAWPNKNGTDDYGNTHFIAMDVSKQQRDDGVKGPIIGNLTTPEEDSQRGSNAGWNVRKGVPAPADQASAGGGGCEEGDIPFDCPHPMDVGVWW